MKNELIEVECVSVPSKQRNCYATAIVRVDTGEELYRVNYWDTPAAAEAMGRSLSDWSSAHPICKVARW